MKSSSPNKTPESCACLSEPKLLDLETSALFEDILERGFMLRVKVTGRSMSPFLRGGEILTIRKVPCETLRKGDLIFYRTSEGVLVMHRIIEKKQGGKSGYVFRTKGDAVSTPDEPVRERNILGKVCRIERTNSDCREKHVDMELPVWKVMNFSLALVSVGKGKIVSHPALAGLLRRIKKAFI